MTGEWITVPRWTPPGVREAIEWLVGYDHPPDHSEILKRLISDDRMNVVWIELSKRHRKTGELLWPPISPRDRYKGDPEVAQQKLMGETFWMVFFTARDKRTARTQDELNKARKQYLSKATKLAREAEQPWSSTEDREVFRKREQLYRTAAADIRTDPDPLTVTRHRGDPLVRGVQIDISNFFKVVVGNRLDGTARTLTAVALGKAKVGSYGRAAFNRRLPD